MKGVNDNASAEKCKNKQLIAKVTFLNQTGSSMLESYVSQLHDKAHNETRK